MTKFFTLEYFRTLVDALNRDGQFTRETKDISTDILNICTDRNEAFLIRIRNGISSCEQVSPNHAAEFKMSAPYSQFVDTEKNGNLESAILGGKIRMDGSMFRMIQMKSKLERMAQIGRSLPKEF